VEGCSLTMLQPYPLHVRVVLARPSRQKVKLSKLSLLPTSHIHLSWGQANSSIKSGKLFEDTHLVDALTTVSASLQVIPYSFFDHAATQKAGNCLKTPTL
jgi:hypothetical protein